MMGHKVVVTEARGGPALMIGNWSLIWKAEGKDTGFVFSIFETQITPGNGLPLHKHPYAEFFYVLEGKLDFGTWNEIGETIWVTCESGGTALAPPGTPHRFFNHGDASARILSVSTYHYERMLKDAFDPDGNKQLPQTQMSPDEFQRIFKTMDANQVYVVADHG
jgi:quercetin dioxygenase-like cupin family protein